MRKPRRDDRIWLNVDNFNKWADLAGLVTVIDKARFCRLDPGNFHHIYGGASPVGAITISRILTAPWPGPRRPEFDDFFIVGADAEVAA